AASVLFALLTAPAAPTLRSQISDFRLPLWAWFRSRSSHWTALNILVLTLGAALPARAQDATPPPEPAIALARRGADLLQNDPAAAAETLQRALNAEEADALDPPAAAITRYNLG